MATNVNSVIAELDRFTNRLVAKIALDANSNLIEATPIDTGWARANWIPNVGRPSGPSQPEGGATPNVSAARSQQSSGEADILTSYTIERGRIYISNGVPYITRLNDGHSNQAPAGFVEQAVDKALRQDILGIGS